MSATINALPAVPTPADTPANFNTKAFNLLGALPGFVNEANALSAEVNAKSADASASAAAASSSKDAAALSATSASSSKDAASVSAVVAGAAAASATNSMNVSAGNAAAAAASAAVAQANAALLVDVIRLNPRRISVDFTVPVGQNATSAGPIFIDDGINVVISNNSNWSIN